MRRWTGSKTTTAPCISRISSRLIFYAFNGATKDVRPSARLAGALLRVATSRVSHVRIPVDSHVRYAACPGNTVSHVGHAPHGTWDTPRIPRGVSAWDMCHRRVTHAGYGAYPACDWDACHEDACPTPRVPRVIRRVSHVLVWLPILWHAVSARSMQRRGVRGAPPQLARRFQLEARPRARIATRTTNAGDSITDTRRRP